jgi:hypothetical protein
MLTVITWLWQQPTGRTKFTAKHVNTWAAMVRRHLTLPHEIACVTDMQGIDPSIRIIQPPHEFENISLPTWGPKRPQCLRRISMFRPDAADIFGERFVSMDLDCVIGGCLDPMFDRPEDFIMCRGTSDARPYNGSMLMMTAGARPDVYTDLTPSRAIAAGREYLGSDQAWISYVLGRGEATWTQDDGVSFYEIQHDRVHPDCRVMFFPGHLKPWHLSGPQPQELWITSNYRVDTREAA